MLRGVPAVKRSVGNGAIVRCVSLSLLASTFCPPCDAARAERAAALGFKRAARCLSACGYARRRPAHSERQNAMQQVRVGKTVMLGCGRELLALGDFGIGVGFNEIRSSVGREAKIDARVSIKPQCSVDAFRRSLNAGEYLRRKVLGRPIYNSHALLITGIVFDLLGGYGLAAHGAEFQFPNRQHSQPIVAETPT